MVIVGRCAHAPWAPMPLMRPATPPSVGAVLVCVACCIPQMLYKNTKMQVAATANCILVAS